MRAFICVVGDDDQTIYQWRGSNLNFIKDFSDRYPDVEKVDLDVNFISSIEFHSIIIKSTLPHIRLHDLRHP